MFLSYGQTGVSRTTRFISPKLYISRPSLWVVFFPRLMISSLPSCLPLALLCSGTVSKYVIIVFDLLCTHHACTTQGHQIQARVVTLSFSQILCRSVLECKVKFHLASNPGTTTIALPALRNSIILLCFQLMAVQLAGEGTGAFSPSTESCHFTL